MQLWIPSILVAAIVEYVLFCLVIYHFHQDNKDKEFIHHTEHNKSFTWTDLTCFQWKEIICLIDDDLTAALRA